MPDPRLFTSLDKAKLTEQLIDTTALSQTPHFI